MPARDDNRIEPPDEPIGAELAASFGEARQPVGQGRQMRLERRIEAGEGEQTVELKSAGAEFIQYRNKGNVVLRPEDKTDHVVARKRDAAHRAAERSAAVGVALVKLRGKPRPVQRRHIRPAADRYDVRSRQLQ